MIVYRLEFLQPDGRWTGPYAAEYMTTEAFAFRDKMMIDHKVHRPYPASETFAENTGVDRYVCASPSATSLQNWFGGYLELFQNQGGHIAIYEVPEQAIAEHDNWQVVYQQKQARCIEREGRTIGVDKLSQRIHPGK